MEKRKEKKMGGSIEGKKGKKEWKKKRKERRRKERTKDTELGRRMNEWCRNKALKTGLLKREDARNI